MGKQLTGDIIHYHQIMKISQQIQLQVNKQNKHEKFQAMSESEHRKVVRDFIKKSFSK